MSEAQVTPTLSQAERLILAILHKRGGNYNGRTRLFKVFYDAHIAYWQNTGGYLSQHKIVKIPYGPGIDDGREILLGLARKGFITERVVQTGEYQETVYTLTDSAPELNLSAQEEAAIESGIKWVGKKSAVQISHLSHRRSRSWNAAEMGREINVYLDAVPDEKYEDMLCLARELKAMANG